MTIAISHEEIGKNPERITKIEAFLNKYKWEGINLPSEKNDWKQLERSIVTIAVNVLYAKKIYILFMFQK